MSPSEKRILFFLGAPVLVLAFYALPLHTALELIFGTLISLPLAILLTFLIAMIFGFLMVMTENIRNRLLNGVLNILATILSPIVLLYCYCRQHLEKPITWLKRGNVSLTNILRGKSMNDSDKKDNKKLDLNELSSTQFCLFLILMIVILILPPFLYVCIKNSLVTEQQQDMIALLFSILLIVAAYRSEKIIRTIFQWVKGQK